MTEPNTNNPKTTYDQRDQHVYGPQTNVAGDFVYTGASIPPGHEPPDPATAQARLDQLPLDHIPDVTTLPPGSWMPYGPNGFFVGRADELQAVAKALKTGSTAAVAPVAATGLGGIGKTQLAAAFVHRYGSYFLGGVLWLSFADPNAIDAEVAQCAAWMAGMPLGVTALDLPEQVRLVRRAWQDPLPRLLVFDNCEDEALLARWRPGGGGCRVLVTSRRGRWSPGLGVATVPVGVLPRAESINLLARFRPDLAADPLLDALAAELGDLPLALHMAGSFLKRVEYDMAPAAYLAQLRAPDLLSHPSLQGGDHSPTGHELHVARTFALSYAQLDGADEVDAAAQWLLACAAHFVGGEPIPRPLLRAAAGMADDADALLAADALARLADLGLLEAESGGALRLHRLLARFVANADLDLMAGAQEAVEETVLAAARRLNIWGDPRPLLAWQIHLRHVVANTQVRRDERTAGLYNEMGFHLHIMGEYEEAQFYYERALIIFEAVLGEQHPYTITSINNFGALLLAMGGYEGAQSYYERALAIRQEVFGQEHPDIAQSLNNLGELLRIMGEYVEAQSYLEQALAVTEVTQGEQHPDTANSLNNLGGLLRVMGDYEGAWSRFERALVIRQTVFGDQHPYTANSLNNLGGLLQAMGDYVGARPYFERALAINEAVLGEQHPDTASNLNNLGMLLLAIGDYEGAWPCLERALAVRLAVLGEQHLDTAQSLENLGGLLDTMRDYEGALPYYGRALAIRLAVLGEQHLDTAQSLNNLGSLLQDMGDYAQARPYLERALAIRLAVLGEQHPDSAQSLNNLGTLFRVIGNYAGAQSYYERALASYEVVLGEQHPYIANTLNNLGILAHYQGDKATSRVHLARALTIYQATLGANHPDTQGTRGSLDVLRAELVQASEFSHHTDDE